MPPSRWTRSVVLFMIACFGSAGANMGVGVVLGLQVWDMTQREFDLGLLGIAQFAPSLILVLLTGSVADKYNRARVFSTAAFAQAAMMGLLALYAASLPASVGPIFIAVVLYGVARAFTTSAQSPLMADLVPRDQLPWLIPRRTLITRVSGIGGPVLAGFLYEVEPAYAYVALGGFLAIGGIASWMMPRRLPGESSALGRTESGRGKLHDALEGWRFMRGSPILLSAISIDLFAVLFGGAVALLPAIAEERLHVNGLGLGVLRGAGGFGAGLAAIVLARRPLRRHVGKVLIGSVAIFGVGTMVLGLTKNYFVALAAMLVLSSADGLSVYIRQALVPLVTPRDTLGRVSALSSVSIGASNELGAFESGVAGELLGSSRAILFGGVATLAVAATYTAIFPVLRNFDRFPEHEPVATVSVGSSG